MTTLQDQLTTSLTRAAEQMRQAGLPTDIASRMKALAEEVHRECTVAVVGRVKAGKSSFINALIGQDLAKTGTTETTATINHFRYGIPPDPQRPVRCYWQGGTYTDETQGFLDSLQGNDLETLQRASGIEHIEYRVDNLFLQNVTLVDTPGTEAAVPDHQNRTAEYIRLHQQLRERHDTETQSWGQKADAIIYLVGPVGLATDRDFLEEFGAATGGRARALNAVGVMAKIDISPQVLERRVELSAKIAGRMESSLNTVVPVSAGIQRALDMLLVDGNQGLQSLMRAMRSVAPPQLEKLLDDAGFYLELPESDSIPVSIEERERLLGNTPWMAFVTIARVASDPALDAAAVVSKLRDVAGFVPLREVLEKHFFARGRTLKAFKVVTDARQVLEDIRFGLLEQRLAEAWEKDKKRKRFLRFIEGANGDPNVASELQAFIDEYLRPPGDIEPLLRQLEREFAGIYHQLEEYNEDFRVLRLVQEQESLFTEAELDELRDLLGLYGLDAASRLSAKQDDVSYIETRQRFWLQASMMDRRPVRREVADRAVWRYGALLSDWLNPSTVAPDH
ncbi:MAG TPA: dynamin family protein [Chloroflexia bacterium]|nr:dynamin family protein [Chloroflexia bacterium]